MTRSGSDGRPRRRYVERAARWLASVRDAQRDAEFAAEGLARCRRGLQIFCALTLALLAASAIESRVAEPGRFATLLQIRLAGAGVLIVIFALVSSQVGERWARVLALASLVVMATTLHALAVASGGQTSPQYDRMNLLILGSAMILTWSPLWTLLACGSVIGVYLVGTAATAGLGATPYVMQNLGRMLTCSAVAVGATVVRERIRWRDFCHRRELAAAAAGRDASEERYRLLVETAGSAIIVLSSDYRILEFNREAEVLYGRSRQEVIGQDYRTRLLPESWRPPFVQLIEGVLAGASIQEIESPVRSSQGERRVVIWNVSRVCVAGDEPLGIIAVAHDITERKRAENEVQRLNAELEQRVQARTHELRTSEERFRTIFESAPIGIVTADRTGRVRNANRAFQAMLGYALEELQQTTLDALTAEPDRTRSRSAFLQLCDQVSRERLMDKRYVSRDGTQIWVHEACAVVHDAAGQVDYVLAMVEDVTERQHAEERAREHQEHLAHVLRVSTMGGMAAELAHELNQPLGAIVNFANGTLVRLRARGIDPEIEQAIAQIAGEGLRAGEIIRRIRDFVRQGEPRREQSDVNHLIRQAAYLVEPDARGRGIPLRFSLDPALPPVEVDRIQFEQVVVNLLRNAIDAVVADLRPDGEVLVETGRADGAITVTVRDTGIGLPPAAGERIFDAFFTSKRGGLGMGLSISRSIVEAHGGRLWATGNADRGMSFTFNVPLAQDGSIAAA
jgi:PAS domain S-box-containing protein